MDIGSDGVRHTVITFEPFLKRKELCGLTDAQIGKRFGLTKDTVNAMRYMTRCRLIRSRKFVRNYIANRVILWRH